MYAFVDVEQYQIVGTGATIDEAKRAYRSALNLEEPQAEISSDTKEISGTVSDIKDVVVSGNTFYYFMLTGDDTVYSASVTSNERLPFMKAGEPVSFRFVPGTSPSEVTEWIN